MRAYAVLLAVLVLVGCDAADPDDGDIDPPVMPASNAYNYTDVTADDRDDQGQPAARSILFINTNTNEELRISTGTNCSGREINPVEINLGEGFRLISSGAGGVAFEYGTNAFFKYQSRSQEITVLLTNRGVIGADMLNISDRQQASINILMGIANHNVLCPS